MRLPRTMRMSGRGEFQRVRAEGRAFPGRFLVLSVVPTPDLPVPFRFAVILTRKIGNAVTRNRIRRRVKGIFSELGERIVPGHHIVIIARYRAPDATFEQLRHDWKVLARKAGLLLPKPSPPPGIEPA
jgi:ribonuclease P protein component